jgi:hypothetical protein
MISFNVLIDNLHVSYITSLSIKHVADTNGLKVRSKVLKY